MKKKVSVLGLGRIGLPTALLLMKNGYEVLGVDTDPVVLQKIKEKKHLREEPGISSLYQETKLKLSHTPKESDIFLIAVPTPLTSEKKCDLSFLQKAMESILPHANEKDLVIIESTCPIGTTHRFKKEFPHLLFSYCPERVLPGALLEELVNNDRVIGGTCESSSEKSFRFYQSFVHGKIWETDAKTAEAVKLVENAYRDVNIAFANELSMFSEGQHLSTEEIIRLSNRHPRVNILSPGPGVGGHCIGIDPYFLMESIPSGPSVIRAARGVNERKKEWVLEKIRDAAEKNRCRKIVCLGATYKENISDFRESPALSIAHALMKDYLVEILDPFHPEEMRIEDRIKEADLIVGLVAHEAFKTIPPGSTHNKIILDFAGVMN